MAKITQYFNSVEELNAYYQNGVPSGVLAIVQGGPDEPALLYTSGNNSPYNPGQKENMGGYVEDPVDFDITAEILEGGSPLPFPQWDPEIWNDMPEYDADDIQYNMDGETFQTALDAETLYYEFVGYEDYPYHVDVTSANSCDINGYVEPDLLKENNLPAETGIRVFAIVDGLKYYLSWINTAYYDDENGGYQMGANWHDDYATSGENDTSEYMGIGGEEDEELWLYNCKFDATSFATENNVETGDVGIVVGNILVWMPIPAGWTEE